MTKVLDGDLFFHVMERMVPQNETDSLPHKDNSDVFFLVSVVAPLILCCFAIFVCAVSSICNTRRKLDLLESKYQFAPISEPTEFTVDLTTKMDSCVEMTSTPAESILL